MSWLSVAIVTLVGGSMATIGATEATTASANSTDTNARRLAAIVRHGIQSGYVAHALHSDDVFVVDGSSVAWYHFTIPFGAAWAEIPSGVEPRTVKIGCTWWNRQADQTYWQLIGAYVTGGPPSFVESMSQVDRWTSAKTVTAAATTDGLEFTIEEQPTFGDPNSITVKAMVRQGRLRTLELWEVQPGKPTVPETLALGDYGRASVIAPPPNEISRTRSVRGVCPRN